MGDFGQLDPVESEIYDVENSEVFANLADCQVLEMLINYRAISVPGIEPRAPALNIDVLTTRPLCLTDAT
jgi:hypothetical protein